MGRLGDRKRAQTVVVDVVIIGAGPGGGMAACRLAASGLTVMLLEKRTLPRHKPCGGALPDKIHALLDWDIEPYIEARVGSQKFLYNHEQPTFEDKPDTPMLLVSRSRFDVHFIERAASRITVRENFSVASVKEDEAGVTIRAKNGEAIHAAYVIAADGATSPTARALGLAQPLPVGAAVDVEIEVTPDVFAAEQTRATFNLYCLPDGYGWIFPKAGYLSCGVAAWRSPKGLPGQMQAFLERSFPPGSIRAIQQYGHPVPLFAGHAPVATRRVCLVGDAARLVDPILGEGIYYAVKSGLLAAEVVLYQFRQANGVSDFEPDWRAVDNCLLDPGQLRALAADQTDCRLYQTLIRRGIARELNLIRLLGQPFFDAPERFYRDHFAAY